MSSKKEILEKIAELKKQTQENIKNLEKLLEEYPE